MYYYFAFAVALYYLYPNTKSYKLLPDVIIGPGGVLGFYSLGICHYMVNHFKLDDKHVAGFSSGAFNTLFMRVHPKKRIPSLRHIFGCKETSSMLILNELMEYVEKKQRCQITTFRIRRLVSPIWMASLCMIPFLALNKS